MPPPANDAERTSRQVAEASREKEWHKPSFLRELFLGRFRLDLVDPPPEAPPERPEFRSFLDRIEHLLREEIDFEAMDRVGEYSDLAIDRLREIGAFGMKIPTEYDGLGFSQAEYNRVMELLGSVDGNLTALLSAHQSIGVPQPLKLFGSDDLKDRYLPRCARGAISGFALTEPMVGSDPARLATTATPKPDGSGFVLNGEKLWCTNGTIAELVVVMARDPETDAISAFVVETDWPGVEVPHRCHFMGLRALANGVLTFRDVEVPRSNLVGEEGDGLKIALTTLNTGRLTLPAATAGTAALCLEICRKWSLARVQWGHPIGKHEAIAHKLAGMAATTLAMQSVARYTAAVADAEALDIRLEAAAAKEWNTVRGWEIVDDTLQIRGGRGYETEASLRARGEAPVPAERLLRDSRINRIFEGSSEIMHLFMAREAVDKHLEVAGTLVDPDATTSQRLAALPGIAAFYARWYPTLWLGWSHWPHFRHYGRGARHLGFVDRSSRRLARSLFHGMVAYRAKLERKQAFLFRAVDIANELFAMTVTVVEAHRLAAADPDDAGPERLADLFCRTARRRVKRLFRDLWRNDDERAYAIGEEVLDGRHRRLEEIALGLGLSVDDLRPPETGDTAEAGRPAASA